MYTPHPAFSLPNGSTKLMRYMSYAKLAHLLHEEVLYFARIDSLPDRYEGTLPHNKYDRGPTAVEHYGFTNLPEGMIGPVDQALYHDRDLTRRTTRINSWCLRDHESISMWDRYAQVDGVAVSTDVRSLTEAFTGRHDVLIGQVHYLDYEGDIIPLSADKALNTFAPFLHKRREYIDETELRALVHDWIDNSNIDGMMYQPVDLTILIHEIIVSPDVGDWLVDIIRSDLARKEIDAPVNRSKLSRTPNY